MADEKGGPPRPPNKPKSTESGTLFRTSLRPHAAPALAGTATGTGSTNSGTPSSSDWQVTNPSQWDSQERSVLGVGSVLKQRFVLERIVGKGGMGTVYCARDLRKEEAQDRFPFVAVKVLNEDFKRHPESLKLLQREARKAQQLAHPNVVSVHDFDRDGANVFIVMELLQGESLDRIIKQNEKGVPANDALRIVTELGHALSYAHQKGVIHLDFKPANAYIGKDGAVKVLDFGIAQAQQRDDTPEPEKTLFQVGDLGALTPSYASLEMQAGEEAPDPRDDVYALACVTYELFAGKHPFGRQSAQFALEYKLWPTRPKGMSRSRWLALQRGLALKRADRTPSVAEFVAEITTAKSSPMVRWGIAAALAAAGIGAVVHWQLRLQIGAPKTATTVPQVVSAPPASARTEAPPPVVQSAAETSVEMPPQPVSPMPQTETLPSAAELIARQRERLLRLVAANDIPAATEVLNELREELPPGDSFVAREAPQAIANANLRMAERALSRSNYAAASDYVLAAQRLNPNSPSVQGARDALTAATRLDTSLRVDRTLNPDSLRAQLATLRNGAPTAYPAVEKNLASLLASRIQREQMSAPSNAAELLTVGDAVFGHIPAIAALVRTAPKPEATPPAQPAQIVQPAPQSQPVADTQAPTLQPPTQQQPPAQPAEEEKAKKRDGPNVIVTF